MVVSTEDRIFKSLGLLSLFTAIFIKNPEIKIYILIPLLVIMSILGTRKYLRDKKAGKPLGRYYLALGMVLLSALIGYGTYWYVINYQ